MENHPIPQDVTGFQFRLIGDITIKQFAYLAAAAILGWISFVLPVSLFIKIPFVVIFAGLGLSLAFLPVEGRPFDVMLGNFLKALFSPNQFIYQKIGGQLSSVSFAAEKAKKQNHEHPHTPAVSTQNILDSYLRNASGPKTELDKKEELFFASVMPSLQPATHQSGFHLQFPFLQAQKPVEKPISEPQEAKIDIQTPEPQPVAEQVEMVAPEPTPTPQTVVQQQKPSAPAPVTPPPAQKPVVSSHAQNPNAARGVMPVAPQDPNVIAGVIRDSRGNILPNILVEIKDQDGNPVRAFKTNQLGQFASATPLLNGSYLLIFEDPKGNQKFQDMQLEVNGQLIAPLEILSTDAREDLRKELFGS